MSKLILEAFLPYRLNRIAAAVSRDLRAVYADTYGLTIPEWRVLATLGQFETMTATAIGRHSAMHKAKVSRAVQELDARHWIFRTANPADRREEALSLTTQGRKTYDRIVPDMKAFEAGLARRLGREGMATIERALALLEALPKNAKDVSTKQSRSA
jgi:DNA-binding MarR family transcriptional regulator